MGGEGLWVMFFKIVVVVRGMGVIGRDTLADGNEGWVMICSF